jgi:hypothetical protein
MGSVQSDKAKISTALDVTQSELVRFARDGATAKELTDAKTYLTGSYPLGLVSNAKIARTLNAYQRQGLAPDYVEKRNAMIEAVTLAQVQRDGEEVVRPLQARRRYRGHARACCRCVRRQGQSRGEVGAAKSPRRSGLRPWLFRAALRCDYSVQG